MAAERPVVRQSDANGGTSEEIRRWSSTIDFDEAYQLLRSTQFQLGLD